MGLTLRQALTLVEVALKKGRETDCAPVAAAVLDDGGHSPTATQVYRPVVAKRFQVLKSRTLAFEVDLV